jgi:hypothetical protein
MKQICSQRAGFLLSAERCYAQTDSGPVGGARYWGRICAAGGLRISTFQVSPLRANVASSSVAQE